MNTSPFRGALTDDCVPCLLALAAKPGGRKTVKYSGGDPYPALAVTIHALALKTMRPF